MRDGRLGEVEVASFRRHVTMCTACAREVRALEALAEPLRAEPDERVDELHVRRERMRLLAAFDRAQVASPRHAADRRRPLWSLAVVLVLVTGAFLFWIARRAGTPTDASNPVVRPDGVAVWSERTDGDLHRVLLDRGTLWIHVDHASGRAHRVLVALPDGELEDTGTTFTVSAEDGHTTRVTVLDGSVMLRVHGKPPVSLGAGEMWAPSVLPPVSGCASAVPSISPAVEPPRLRPMRTPPSARVAPAASSALRGRPSVAVAAAPAPDPSVEFRGAMAAFDQGDNHAAAAGFGDFLARHPDDPRAEDAGYLRVIALQRCGDQDAMRLAAEDYVRRYPEGFRLTEVKALRDTRR